MDQTLYYIFSTTAQVLAAMLVFYGLFFLRRMEIFRKRFAELTENFLMEIDEKDKEKEKVIKKVKPAFNDEDWKRLPYRTMSSLRQGKYRWIINAVSKAFSKDTQNDILEDAKNGMNAIVSARKSFTCSSVIAVVLGFVHLIGAILILSLVSFFDFNCSNYLLYGLLTVNILLLLIFIFFIAKIIIRTFLQEIEHDRK